MTLAVEQVLSEPGGAVAHVYFPSKGVVCDIVVMAGGRTIDVGTTGNEGLVGLPLFFGNGISLNRTMCQVGGDSMRMTAAAFRAESERPGPLRALLLQYAHVVLFLTQQSVASNARHTVAQRCARWLLMTHDRMVTDQFSLLQSMLANMLCVRRLSVSAAASDLQGRGLIRYSRGKVTVIDRVGLEGASCECYRLVRDQFDQLYANPLT